MFLNPSIDCTSYQIVLLKPSLLSETEDLFICGLKSVFDSLMIFDNELECSKYLISINPKLLNIYLIVFSPVDYASFQGTENVQKLYNAKFEDTNKLILRIRHDVREETTGPFRLIERSVRQLKEKYTPYVSLMANLDLHMAVTRDIKDTEQVKQQMLTACRRVYHDNAQQLERIEDFGKSYNTFEKGKAIYWYTRK